MDKQINKIFITENEINNYQLLIDAHKNVEFYHICFHLAANAVLTAEVLIMHCGVELILECVLEGKGAQATINVAYGMKNFDQVRIKTIQYHSAPYTQSRVDVRGVVYDNAQAFYQGTIFVHKDAPHCNASQENKNILMSNNSRAVSEPQLEVLTNEVQCFHGSATGRCDDEQLFYCAARGIDEKSAQQLLLKAFFADLFVNEMLKEKIVMLFE